ncbi:MAG: SDR family NAD(P)-dependent oxidoreductase [Anaerolineae bacterium]|jgi:NAD(P)-dependent dehydrogenase (short-subunit alcohol dehydrogenase family)|nr:SDR family NAD(P)-dependent oxidoreductase [Anaerolineae bacterium]
MKLMGKTALVTGAAGNGLGRSIALTLAREGANVVVNYRSSTDKAQQIVDHITAGGGKAAAVQGDVFTAEGVNALVEGAKATFGPIEICIIGPGGEFHVTPLDQTDAATALKNVQDETAPLFHLMGIVLPGMVDRNWGRIIGIGTHPEKLSPSFTYNAGKMARMQALLLMRDECWQHGITVNILAPGPVMPVESFDDAVELMQHGAAWQNRKNVTPQDAAETVAFLCSDAGDYISGCVLPLLFH